MKFAVVILACVAAASAQFSPFTSFNSNQYNPQNQYRKPTLVPYRPVTSTFAPIYVAPTPKPFVPVPKSVSDDRNAQTLKSGNDIYPDGSYTYFFETNNGIAAQEQGSPRNFGGNPPVVPDVAQGSHSWTSPEGKYISISYVADENGYQPVGDAIPTSPPVPAQIARALEYIARNPPKN